ncbi:MAG: hypothetical protein MR487_12890 [Lachnospiraceae bacterium]|nr:hypothetical protein [Lachnospiraceae bacterium]
MKKYKVEEDEISFKTEAAADEEIIAKMQKAKGQIYRYYSVEMCQWNS